LPTRSNGRMKKHQTCWNDPSNCMISHQST
jgi:hypothetical protein